MNKTEVRSMDQKTKFETKALNMKQLPQICTIEEYVASVADRIRNIEIKSIMKIETNFVNFVEQNGQIGGSTQIN